VMEERGDAAVVISERGGETGEGDAYAAEVGDRAGERTGDRMGERVGVGNGWTGGRGLPSAGVCARLEGGG